MAATMEVADSRMGVLLGTCSAMVHERRFQLANEVQINGAAHNVHYLTETTRASDARTRR